MISCRDSGFRCSVGLARRDDGRIAALFCEYFVTCIYCNGLWLLRYISSPFYIPIPKRDSVRLCRTLAGNRSVSPWRNGRSALLIEPTHPLVGVTVEPQARRLNPSPDRPAEGARHPRNPFARLGNRPHRSKPSPVSSRLDPHRPDGGGGAARRRLARPQGRTRQGFETTASPNGYVGGPHGSFHPCGSNAISLTTRTVCTSISSRSM